MKIIFRNPKDFLFIDYLINPIPGLVILLMAANDHYLKYQFPGALTGKLSDFCGMFYFPLFICAGFILISNFYQKLNNNSRRFYINRCLVFTAIGIAASVMALIKLNNDFNHIVVLFLNNFGFQNQITKDPSDLISFVVFPFTYWYSSYFFNKPPL
jgi:hypothetical protein